MIEDKVGQKEYLGIKIDYDKENKLNKSYTSLNKSYTSLNVNFYSLN